MARSQYCLATENSLRVAARMRGPSAPPQNRGKAGHPRGSNTYLDNCAPTATMPYTSKWPAAICATVSFEPMPARSARLLITVSTRPLHAKHQNDKVRVKAVMRCNAGVLHTYRRTQGIAGYTWAKKRATYVSSCEGTTTKSRRQGLSRKTWRGPRCVGGPERARPWHAALTEVRSGSP